MKTKSPNVSVANRDALTDLIRSVMGRWRHTPNEVIKIAELAEQRLDRIGVPKGKRKGVIGTHTSRGPGASAYRYSVSGSTITLRRAADHWRVIGFAETRVYPQQGGKLILHISPEQETAAIEAMRVACGIVVRPVEAEHEVPMPYDGVAESALSADAPPNSIYRLQLRHDELGPTLQVATAEMPRQHRDSGTSGHAAGGAAASTKSGAT